MKRAKIIAFLLQISKEMTKKLASSSLVEKRVASSRWMRPRSWPPLNSLLCSVTNLSTLLQLKKSFCNECVATECKRVGILNEPGFLHVAGSVGRLFLKELPFIKQLKHHSLVRNELGGVNKSIVALEYCGAGVVMVFGHSYLVCWQKRFIFPADGAYLDLI